MSVHRGRLLHDALAPDPDRRQAARNALGLTPGGKDLPVVGNKPEYPTKSTAAGKALHLQQAARNATTAEARYDAQQALEALQDHTGDRQ